MAVKPLAFDTEARAALLAGVEKLTRAVKSTLGPRGRNALLRSGRLHELPGKVRLDVQAGDAIVIETPGGGGYDPSTAEWAAMAPALARRIFREERYAGPTAGISAVARCASTRRRRSGARPAAAAAATSPDPSSYGVSGRGERGGGEVRRRPGRVRRGVR